MAFQINQGATIWDEDGGVGDYSWSFGSGPFMVLITPIKRLIIHGKNNLLAYIIFYFSNERKLTIHCHKL